MLGPASVLRTLPPEVTPVSEAILGIHLSEASMHAFEILSDDKGGTCLVQFMSEHVTNS